jgi:hypothetical protein
MLPPAYQPTQGFGGTGAGGGGGALTAMSAADAPVPINAAMAAVAKIAACFITAPEKWRPP